ncbi:uroporphyrinogen-III C-methyltransferase [Candidatus Marinamargulisbacteria bacterium SCGC AG-343-D04]|nr:uroporphyrinogen-III C-methyltransferase [Candidatus Marinamargulisbacteria bacterium SCGC AG-343-D04]
MTGYVYLVGAGPGDVSLMTVKSMQCLKRADVLLLDHLVSPTCITQCREDVIIHDVGKQRGKHSTTQDEINEMMMMYARDGKCVVRLKGGDPFIFGRIGEEIECLVEAGIPFEVLPGVSSAIAGPGYAGIPLTHRNQSRSVAFVTGTLKRGEVPIELPKADTLVFLMALAHCDEITSELIKRGLFSKDTAAAIISKATCASQEDVYGTLDSISQQSESIETPALLVVGDVVNMADRFSWRDHRPLSGKRVVVLRPRHQGKEWVETLSILGAEVLHMPLMKILSLKEGVASITSEVISSTTLLVLTSANAVEHFFEAMKGAGIDSRRLSNAKIAVVGELTASSVRKRGIFPDYIPKIPSLKGLMEEFPDIFMNQTCLWPTSLIADDRLEVLCREESCDLRRVNIYEPKRIEKVYGEVMDGDIVIFSSPSIVNYFCESGLGEEKDIKVCVLGKTTYQRCVEKGFKNVVILENADVSDIVNHL